MTFDLSTVDIPTATAYDAEAPLKNLETLAYVLLQVLNRAQTAGLKFSGSGDLKESIESFGLSVLAIADIEGH